MSPITYSGASCSSTARRPRRVAAPARDAGARSPRRGGCAAPRRRCACRAVWPFQRATRASPWAMSSSLDVERRGVEKVEPPPGQHALPGPRSLRAHLRFSARADAFRMAIAADEVVVDHADRLHEGVDDGRAAEIEALRLAAPWKSAARFRFRRECRRGSSALTGQAPRRRNPRGNSRSRRAPESRARRVRLRPWSAIFARLRTMPASSISASTCASSKRAMIAGSKLANALRKLSRLRRIVIQESPAWKPSRISFSKSARSSYSGTPHSVS